MKDLNTVSPFKLTAKLSAISPQWAAALHPSMGSLLISWPRQGEQVSISTLYCGSPSTTISTFDVCGERISLVAAALDGVDARQLFLKNNSDALNTSFMLDLISRLACVPAESVRPIQGSTEGDSARKLDRQDSAPGLAALVRWSSTLHNIAFDFLFPLESDLGVKLLETSREQRYFQRPAPNLNFAVYLQIFDLGLTLAEITSLSAGDVLLGLAPSNTSFFANIGSASFIGRIPVLLSLGVTSMSISPHQIELHNSHATSDHDDDLDRDLEETEDRVAARQQTRLPGVVTRLKIDCVLSGLNMSLSDLQNLEGGHVLTIPMSPWRMEVDLRLGDQVIGRGRLTTVNDVIAVQIIESYFNESGASSIAENTIHE